MGLPVTREDRPAAAELGERWVELETHADAGAFAQVRVVAAEIAKDLEKQAAAGVAVEALRERLKETLEHGRNRAFEVGMEAVGRSFVGLYEAAAKLQSTPEPKRKRAPRRRQRRATAGA
ncbi:MAG: hypothetical protein AAF658_13955 [Myxococcota bacterium]